MSTSFQKAPAVCPMCKKEETHFSFIRNYQNTYGEFTLYECNQCKVQFWIPLKNPGSTWYEKDLPYRRDEITSTPRITKGAQHLVLRLYGSSLKGKKVLDVGCGPGEFLAALRGKGCEAWGVDFDRNAIVAAQKHFQLPNLYAMSIEEFFEKASVPQFDLITSFEVIEHVEDPMAFVKLMAGKLKSDGRIIISTPSRERVLPNIYPLDFPPHHLIRWNAEALSNMFKPFGFEAVSVRYVDGFLNLFQVMNTRFRFGLATKAVGISAANVKATATQLTNLLIFLGWIKDIVIGGAPSVLFWIWGIAAMRKNGDMIIEFQKQ